MVFYLTKIYMSLYNCFMSKEENVINYYVLCNKLKTLIRSGWKKWNVNKDRLESVAEHIYGTQMLAIAIKHEYNYDVDLLKVIFMLAIHESEEIFIGDLTQFDISREEKLDIGHKAIHNIFENILDGYLIEEVITEFDEMKTKESIFAYQCDKLECDLQAKVYDEEGCVNLDKTNIIIKDETVNSLLNSGLSFGQMWLEFGLQTYPYDENFKKISNFAKKNKILKSNN